MATKTVLALEDDLDGGPASETLKFGLGGSEYEIDLNANNAAALRKQLEPFIAHGRKIGSGRRNRPARSSASREQTGAIRLWAKEHGLAVSARGRIPSSVIEQYERAAGRER